MALIRHVPERKALLIQTPDPEEMGVLLKLPSRRWMRAAHHFVVPLIRTNCIHLLQASKEGKLRIGETLSEHTLEMTALIHNTANRAVGTRKFPDWYVFKTQPSPDQRAALEKCYRDDAFALLMKMGTGKSKVFIDYATAAFYEKRIEAVVMICPLTIKGVWMGDGGELIKHSPVPFVAVDVDSDFDWTDIVPRQDRLFWLMVGVESLSQGKTYDKLLPFLDHYKCLVGVDEASRIKNHKTIRTQRVVSLRPKAAIRGIATGTPTTKQLMDLYALYDFLDPHLIGVNDYYSFRNRYAVMGGYKMKDIVAYNNVDELMGLIEPVTYRCDKPVGLPPQRWALREVRLSPEQKDMYQKVKKAQIPEVKVANVLNRMGKLQEVANGFLREDPVKTINPLTGREKVVQGKIIWELPPDKNPKIIALHEQLEELGEEQLIIWCRYRWQIAQMAEAMRAHGTTAEFHGDVTLPERMAIRDRFQAGAIRNLVGTQQIGGMGYTFTAAHYMNYMSNTNSLEDRLQSEDRIHRRGQEEECLYTDFPAKGTVEGTIMASLQEKKSLDQYVREKLDSAVNRAALVNELLGEPE